MKKRVILLTLCILMLISLCGCASLQSDTDSLLCAPKLTGELQPVQEALEKAIGSKYSLKFPSLGQTKAAITLIDLTGDTKNEAIAFYSTSEDNTVTMHVAVLDCSSGSWVMAAKSKLVAGGVERVYFNDTDGDGRLEIIIGWNVYGAVDKKVSVYQYTGNSLISLVEEPYTEFLICDLDNGFSADLLTVYHNLTESTAYAKYFDISSRGVAQLGVKELDGKVTAYYEPVLSKNKDGSYCVYIDCVKGVGLLTEILYVENGELIAPFYNPETKENSFTYRPALVPCRDFDSDGALEIPIMTTLPVDMNQSASAAYLTVWNGFDSKELLPEAYTLMNYSDSYYVELTKELAESTTTVRNLDNRERIIFEYDYKKKEFKNELFRIRVVSQSAFNSGIYNDQYIVLNKNESLVWLARISNEAEEFGINNQTIKNIFHIITN